tara:strand:+ start:447 stop:644 length:198 start_codon:yes stop_codon:yes gene_type:complete
MTIEIALCLLAAAVPVTALVVKMATSGTRKIEVQLAALEERVAMFQKEMYRTLAELKHQIERLNT